MFSSNINWICQKRKQERKNFKPIDIIYKPTKSPKINPFYYYTEDISKAYANFYNAKDKNIRAYSCYECYYCWEFFFKKERHKRHIENCAGVPGVVYNFNTKNLISFQDSFNAKGDLPFLLYFDFETTAPTDNCFDPEQKKNVCCVLCFNCWFSSCVKFK